MLGTFAISPFKSLGVSKLTVPRLGCRLTEYLTSMWASSHHFMGPGDKEDRLECEAHAVYCTMSNKVSCY